MSREAPPTEPNETGAPVAPETSPAAPSSPGRGGQAAPALPTGAAPPAAEGQSQLSLKDALERIKASQEDEWVDVGDDDLLKVAPINRRYNSFLDREKTKLTDRLTKEAEKKQQEAQAYVNWDAYLKTLESEPQRLVSELDDPQKAQAYAAIKAWRKNGGLNGGGGTSRETVANEMVNGLIGELRNHDEWADLTNDEVNEILADKDVSKVLTRLLVAGTSKERKRLEAKVKAEIEAGINEAVAKRNLSAREPESPRGAVVGTGDGLTLEQYTVMTPQERRKLRQENPRAVDAMMSAIQETAGAGA